MSTMVADPQTELGRALRMAWMSYVHRLDEQMRAAGFGERRFPMIYMFGLYAEPGAMTISEIGRRFLISRQAASKIVAELHRRGYVEVSPSAKDRREKVVELTAQAIEYVEARRQFASALDAQIHAQLGKPGLDQLHGLLAAVAETAASATRSDPPDLAGSPKLGSAR